MQLTGEMLIGADAVVGSAGTLYAFDPSKGAPIDVPAFGIATQADVDRACELARGAFDAYRAQPLAARAAFLEAIADEIVALGDALIERAHAETGLPAARLQGERARTVGQLRLFARVVRDGRFLAASIDPAQPTRTPLPRSDLRLQKIPLGPVAVFGASNFPLAFSVAGGDTASALAAGCPVIVKGHEAHLGTSELVGRAIRAAVEKCGMPAGVFSLLVGPGRVVGTALVNHPAIQAVGFTGSRQGGMALVQLANARPQPIPVYAEMSSINPVVLFPAALAARGDAIATGFVESLTLGVGQFCTNPGLVLAIDGPELDRFEAAAAQALAKKPAGVMLTRGIADAYRNGRGTLAELPGVREIGAGEPAQTECQAGGALYDVAAQAFLSEPAFGHEVFGPSSLIVRCRDFDEVARVLDALEGQLTATLQMDADDKPLARRLLPILERKAGRLLVNGFPTGVEVCDAMVHGGPFPATSNAAFTSVGATAIDRFLRPVCYQDFPDDLLPEALQQHNPLSIPRLRDGKAE
ncbi:aldehyde dehydrogenase (NADP(+)) [Burkholderia multivorans]|uniref:aldehyde dehydrogenase (NADP(+)) n=1 Tax=Burkholderia multivorans TaxID=87883 RepID=UPI0013DEEB59|nr:aldehyde dehydrogenase (NADP(+)) [Burkholderia multivorans]MBU9123591.1 aldehyde dehydrogenase (NADP(+)) [Burkholderia multivorans]MBU9223330.1 aldehyde dehydrogenase (NADP(+)) [Burkholderia multivorans]MBU9419627.1 aldehyde dehydrogenase (NADP(+)) [Burkholderia multivorans]MBU9619005.1 aldehyde dehydrogenase (NADP(+)) [Burkholderia multivorans]NGM76389.1 aldehyde dehydrogenase (NADP(+)) [Burkholderia multivorans]